MFTRPGEKICVLVLMTLTWLLVADVRSAPRGEKSVRFEQVYVQMRDKISRNDVDSRLELCQWCRDRGYIREMLTELKKIIETEPAHEQARSLLHQQGRGEGWIFHVTRPTVAAARLPDIRDTSARRRKLLESGKKQTLKLAKKSFHFDIWSDLDRARVQDYSQLLNIFYDRLKGFFQITETERHVLVLTFSKRSDYLAFYQRTTGKSGEHSGGFFTYNSDLSLLCFYDRPYGSDEVFNTARHECTHLLIKHCLQGAEITPWLNEGLACFFAADGLERTGSYAASCLLSVRHALEHGRTITLDDLITTPYSKYTFDHYAASWAWICFLRSNKDTKLKLGRLLAGLRQKAREGQEDGWEETTNLNFARLVGDPDELQPAWLEYVRNELVPETPEQLFDCADLCFEKAGGWHREDPPLKPVEEIEYLHEGESWLEEASATNNKQLAARCELAKSFALLARSNCFRYSAEEKAHTGARIARALDDFMSVPENASLLYDAGVLSLRTLSTLRDAADVEEEEGQVCDLIGAIEALKNELQMKIDRRETPALIKDELEQEKRLLAFIQSTAEALIAEARFAFSRDLAKDPTSHRSAAMWLRLALLFAPDDLDSVFPHLVFQAEHDPDDLNLIALAAAYGAMGKPGFGHTLMKRAAALSPSESALLEFAAYVE